MRTTRTTITAKWVADKRDDGDYSCYVATLPDGEDIVSWADPDLGILGDVWYWGENPERLADGDEFDSVSILLRGGPRHGVTVG